MKGSYGEGLANHTSLESCGNCSNAVAEALTEGNIVVPAAVRTQGRGVASNGLQGVRRKAQLSKSEVSALLPEVKHVLLIESDLLKEATSVTVSLLARGFGKCGFTLAQDIGYITLVSGR